MKRRCNLLLILAFLMGILAIPIKSYAYRSVDDAISWAENKIGSGAYYHDGYNWCWTFARDTYGGAAISGVGSAIAAWNYNGALLGPRHADNNIPRGAFVFFAATSSNGGYGHVGLYIGGGKMIHAWPRTVRQTSINSGGNYLGWRWPVAWTSGSPDDPDGNLSINQVQGSKEGQDVWGNSFELSMDDIYDMDFRVKVQQEGGAWPSDTKASFYLSLDKELDSGDIKLGTKEYDLTKETARSKSISLKDVNMSDYISSPGTYYVLTRVKFDGGEKESSSSDSKHRVKLTVFDTTVPDLTISSFQLINGTTALNGGSPFGMKVEVQNVGNENAGSFQIKYDINGPSTGGVWKLLGEKSFTAGSLAAGAIVPDSTNDSFAAAPAVEGSYTLRSCVDSSEMLARNNKVTESNEGNNCSELTVYVSPSSNPSLKPVYRFWSDSYQAHFYTITESEKDGVISNDPNWRYEGIAYYAYPSQEDDSSPIYRFWSDNYQAHFYTIIRG